MAKKLIQPVAIEISPGELLDRIAILQIKQARFIDPSKRASVQAELRALTSIRRQCIQTSVQIARLVRQLKHLNEQIWDAEDQIRAGEHARDFGNRFVLSARAIYTKNDQRFLLKRRIDGLLGACRMEEKQYLSISTDHSRGRSSGSDNGMLRASVRSSPSPRSVMH